uniref:WSC domain-containing protein 1-like n=1 Tax=Saccoglossus kowalevskii TaxID=10224 RepID=A0ABM0MCP8_SACKO
TVECDLHFSEKKLPIAVLASPPGAGNTWVRYLLQQATGIYTGSVYHDQGLYDAGFLGEMASPYDGQVLVSTIKNPHDMLNFSAVILLIRNIYAATLSEINRKMTSNQTVIADFNKFVLNTAKYLSHVVRIWLLDHRVPTLVVHYEDLIKNTVGEVTPVNDHFFHFIAFIMCILWKAVRDPAASI